MRLGVIQHAGASDTLPCCSGRCVDLNRIVSSRLTHRPAARQRTVKVCNSMRTNSASLRLGFVETEDDEGGPSSTGEAQRPSTRIPIFSSRDKRDADGMSLVGKNKSLKINLDLALYRARQTRINSFSAKDLKERSKLIREAEVALRNCLAMDPEDGRAYVILGKLLVQQRRYSEALELYEEGSIATGGTNAHIWTAWAYLAAKRGNIGLARKLYDASLVANPAHAAAYHGWGLLEKEQGNFVRARDLWTKGINATKASPNPYLYQSLAVLASELDCIDEARKWFRAGTRTLKGSSSHALWHAWALMEERQKSEPDVIRALYRQGQKVSPRSRYLHLSWAIWEKSQGNLEAARKLFKSGTYLNPRDAAIFQAWALLEEEAGDIEKARQLFKRGSKADPSHLYIWQAWGCMEMKHGEPDTAREIFQQGVWAAPPRAKHTALIFQAWAVLEKKVGNVGLARELFKCAVKADPKSEPSWMAWALMEEELGALDRANELRNFSQQERTEVVKPANFTTLPQAAPQGVLAPVFGLLNKWFQRYEDAGALPSLRTIDEGDLSSDDSSAVIPVPASSKRLD